MATSKKPKAAPLATVDEAQEAERAKFVAGLQAEGLLSNALLMESYGKKGMGAADLPELIAALRKQCSAVAGGDLKGAEVLLVTQAAALNTLFFELTRRSGLNMGEHMVAMETYMRLALRAQTQCRATLETLAAIKNPPVVFAKQANINNGGQQQVNNGQAAALPPPSVPVALVVEPKVSALVSVKASAP